MQGRHAECFTVTQLPALAEISRQTLNKIPATACPFCERWDSILKEANPKSSDGILVVTPAQYRHHVGAHMEQLALFAIPRTYEHAGNDAASTERSTGAKANSCVKENYDFASQMSDQDMDNPPLHIAAYVGNEAEVVRLLENGEDVNTKGDTWGSALGSAVVGGHSNVVMILLERGADFEAPCGQYNTVLEAAAAGEDRDIEKLLQEKAFCGGGKYTYSIEVGDDISPFKLVSSDQVPHETKSQISVDIPYHDTDDRNDDRQEDSVKEYIKDGNRDYLPIGQKSSGGESISNEDANERGRERREQFISGRRNEAERLERLERLNEAQGRSYFERIESLERFEAQRLGGDFERLQELRRGEAERRKEAERLGGDFERRQERRRREAETREEAEGLETVEDLT